MYDNVLATRLIDYIIINIKKIVNNINHSRHALRSRRGIAGLAHGRIGLL
jgi:hypothetical protein